MHVCVYKMNTFNTNGSKDIYNVKKDFYLESILFFWTFYSWKNPEKSNCFHKNNK